MSTISNYFPEIGYMGITKQAISKFKIFSLSPSIVELYIKPSKTHSYKLFRFFKNKTKKNITEECCLDESEHN